VFKRESKSGNTRNCLGFAEVKMEIHFYLASAEIDMFIGGKYRL
jgi:hypothetical protein